MLENISLKPYNTFGFDQKAQWFTEASSITEILQAFEKAYEEKIPLHILGGGSNVLLTQNLEGIVLKNNLKGISKLREDDDFIWLKVAGGEVWHDFTQYCVNQNWGGIENMSLIPGSVGAAPMQNIGAYGVELQSVFVSLEAIHRKSGEIKTFTKEECDFGYRYSVFKGPEKDLWMITSVVFKLTKRNHQLKTHYGNIEEELKGIENPTIKDISQAVINIRQSKLPNPAELGNAGSFFKNPYISLAQAETLKKAHPNAPTYPVDSETVKVAAGWLIEQAGWKGLIRENHGVHKKQALVLVNYGGAQGQDVYQLSEDIKQDVLKKFHIELKREVNIW